MKGEASPFFTTYVTDGTGQLVVWESGPVSFRRCPMIDPDLSKLLDNVHRDQTDLLAKLVAADRAAELDLLSTEWLLRFVAGLQQNTDCWLLSTGSRTYGIPTPDSDWDWVLRLKFTSRAGVDLSLLIKSAADERSAGERGEKTDYGELEPAIEGAYRYGPVNLLLVHYERQWKAWEEGTSELLDNVLVNGPQTRERAIEVFEEMRHKYLEAVEPQESHFADDIL